MAYSAFVRLRTLFFGPAFQLNILYNSALLIIFCSTTITALLLFEHPIVKHFISVTF